MDAKSSGPVTIETNLGDDIIFHEMGGVDGISRLFVYEIDVLSPRSDLTGATLLDSPVTVHLVRTDGGDDAQRHWNGWVTSFQYVGTGDDEASRYRLTVRPWLWYLTQSGDCRIFQNMRIPDIITQVFKDRGFHDFESSLSEQYDQKEYVVQFRETDFDFVMRLMQREGIYFYFRHTDGKHTLVLADSPDAHESVSGCDQLHFRPHDENRDETEQYVHSWRFQTEFATNILAHGDYDFTRPRLDLYATRDVPNFSQVPEMEVYEYPGGFSSFADGERYAGLRIEQRRASTKRWTGDTNARALAVGSTFALVDHPRDDQNAKYLVVNAHYRVKGHNPRTSEAHDQEPFSCSFRVAKADVTFRTAPWTRKPIILGPQTAVVVGPPGQEIWTDQYGRVKVQFHWDRRGKDDENSSCFVRVSQSWAGGGFGAQFIPRIGHEVIVDFIEGDPDRPLITGTVYNGANATPFSLPENQTQSGFRTRSTPGGTQINCNEVRFEDRIGEEELYIQAEKDMNVLVKNDQSSTINVDRTLHVGVDDTQWVGRNRKRSVGVAEDIAIGATQTVNVGAAQSITVGAIQSIKVVGDRTADIGATDTTNVGGNSNLVVDGDLWRQVRGDVETETDGDQNETYEGTYVSRHTGHRIVVVGSPEADRSSTLHVEGFARAYASTQMEAIALKGFTITCGKSIIKILPDSITFSSPTITLVTQDAEVQTAKFNVAGTDAVTIGGSTVTMTSSGATVTLDSNATVEGAQVKLNGGSGSSASPSSKPPKITTLQLQDQNGNPLANQSVILRYGGEGGEERTVALDDTGSMTIVGEDPFEVLFPGTQDAAKS